ncbi:DUF4242 domain-containing protein [Pseudaestuariivita atlantica]|uniref:Membrane protein n=1 Tax=Pseudaestuariivita atlantica TaxID=1317121 RepID=A0A0L1JM40_9RHOB|nr:DUF4242 domain-containing protein [Pseudaestuariivita atlantica]KNG92797.1 membrane protein [Pseudaestuariivita atlantica]
MQTYVIEREIPGIGSMSPAELSVAAQTSNATLARLAPRVQWQHSYVADNKSFCIYLAEDEAAIKEHAQASGFPADRITPIGKRIDPTTARL